MKLVKFGLTAQHSSVFGKVRELAGEIKYSFAISELMTYACSMPPTFYHPPTMFSFHPLFNCTHATT